MTGLCMNSTRIDKMETNEERAPRYGLNESLSGFSCLRCHTCYPVTDFFEGCPACLERGHPTSVEATYIDLAPAKLQANKARMVRFGGWLPYTSFPTLGEGDTPLLSLPAIAEELGIAQLFLKNEGQNPTGSHKDRASALAVARAVSIGASTVVAASSGNAGASIAAYAAAAGMRSIIVTTPEINDVWRRAIEFVGAKLVAVTHVDDRWKYLNKLVCEEDCFPVTNYLNPPVGSNHFGVEGLKTVAFELHEQLGSSNIDAVMVPTSRGDLLWGIYRGFSQLRSAGITDSIPRMYAVEPFPRITRVLAGEDIRISFPGKSRFVSIGGSTVTFQAVAAINGSGGGSVAVSDVDGAVDQRILARNGVYLEISCAAALTGLRKLRRDNTIGAEERVVIIGSSSGYKELSNFESAIPIVA